MARHGEGLLPAAYALLGPVGQTGARPHGYELHRSFAVGGPLRAVCRLPLNQHYALFESSLAGRVGLVAAGDLATAGLTPPRRPLTITPHRACGAGGLAGPAGAAHARCTLGVLAQAVFRRAPDSPFAVAGRC